MGLNLRINWFDKKTEEFIGEEYSNDLGDDGSVIEKIGLPLSDTINNGEFDVVGSYVIILQPYFKNKIEIDEFYYSIGFDYQDGDW